MSDLAMTFQAFLSGTFSKDLDLGSPSYPVNILKKVVMTAGTGDNQGNEYFDETHSLAATTKTYDLTTGQNNPLGEDVSLTKLKGLLIINKETTDGRDLTVSGNALSMLTALAEYVIPPGGFLFITAPLDGWTITNTTQDQLTLDSGANTVSYDIAFWGLT